MDCSISGFPVLHYFLEFTQIHAIQPSHPLSSPSAPAFNLSQHQGFSNESVLHTRWPKYGNFSFNFSITPSNEYSGLISFKIVLFSSFLEMVDIRPLILLITFTGRLYFNFWTLWLCVWPLPLCFVTRNNEPWVLSHLYQPYKTFLYIFVCWCDHWLPFTFVSQPSESHHWFYITYDSFQLPRILFGMNQDFN